MSIYEFGRHFYPKQLTLHLAFTVIEPIGIGIASANALLFELHLSYSS